MVLMFIRRMGRVSAAACLALTATTLVSCADRVENPRPQIIAALYPLEFVAEAVAGKHADVISLAAGAVEPHDQELTAQQRASISEATVVLYVKGLSPSVDEATSNRPNATDALGVIGGKARARDPHMWLNPLLLLDVARALASRLSDVDPTHRTDYQANADKLVAELTALDSSILAQTALCGQRLMVTTHGAFAYFASRYKFRQVNALGTNSEAQPSPAALARIVDIMRTSNTSTVYAEVGVEDAVARTLAAETGARIRTLYPMETPVAGEDYLSMMLHNREQVAAGQVCQRRIGGGSSIATPDTTPSGVVQ